MPPADAAHTRAAVYLYTQTGQLREVADAFTAPMRARGWDVRFVDVQPSTQFPFPWPIRRFFEVFPRAVDPRATVDLVEPPDGFGSAPDELVILGSQVWYLAPSLPIRSLLSSHPEAVRGRDVVVLIACRNMWYSAAIELTALLTSAGARSVRVVVATDTRRSATTLVTTLRWLLTGRREAFLWFGRAGVGDDELRRVSAEGRELADGRPCSPRSAPVAPALAMADLWAGNVFRLFAPTVDKARRVGFVAHTTALVLFVVGLAVAIVFGLPLIGVAALLGGPTLARRVGEHVHRRITSDVPLSDQEMAV